jgi:hypothetical protein
MYGLGCMGAITMYMGIIRRFKGKSDYRYCQLRAGATPQVGIEKVEQRIWLPHSWCDLF